MGISRKQEGIDGRKVPDNSLARNKSFALLAGLPNPVSALRGPRKGPLIMFFAHMRKWTVLVTALILLAFVVCVPVLAEPVNDGIIPGVPDQTLMPENGMPRDIDGMPGDDANHTSALTTTVPGNLGDWDGDGVIEDSGSDMNNNANGTGNVTVPGGDADSDGVGDRLDPDDDNDGVADSLDPTPGGNNTENTGEENSTGWIAILICIVIVIAVILVIVALIPKKKH